MGKEEGIFLAVVAAFAGAVICARLRMVSRGNVSIDGLGKGNGT
jgi:hypothetical protein